MEDLRYPIGKFQYAGVATEEQRKLFIANIAETPARLRVAVADLNEEQLKTPYRPEGWTIRQLAHHLPDSHLNAYTRFRLAMTEEQPTIRPYYEDRWAELNDSRNAPIDFSLDLLESLHKRWVYFLESLSESDFSRSFQHPELGLVSLDKNLALYSWHGQHHVAQITSLRVRLDW
ncbi:putative metal-dependent hydrolase [bacterium]|nr:putative metal-dependent hydrolase [bacterium]MCI0603997.1 putative metal-dependent hydrolase [bacterium]